MSVQRSSFTTLAAVAAAAMLAACAQKAPPPPTPTASASSAPRVVIPVRVVNGALVGPTGMTLYTFDRDGATGSACNGPCAQNWPPLLAAAGAQVEGPWTLVKRDDGTMQYAYKGKPLYYWAKDTKPGDMTGDNFNNVWKVGRP